MMNENDIKEKFLDLLEPLLDKLYMYAITIEKTKENAEDLVSETILTTYEHFPKLKDHSGFKGYLFKTARNKSRRRKRRSWIFGKYNEEKALNLPSQEPSPDLPLDVELLYKALSELPPKQNEAVVLFEISGFSMKEIQKIQGGSLSGVKTRIKRGREKLTQMLCETDHQFDINNIGMNINSNADKKVRS